jgi:ankyrin repeat protein
MEVIRIPQVSLVDASGRRIGVYTDDPDWWQQLKLKNQNITAPPPAIKASSEENKDATRPSSGGSSSQEASVFGSTARLIKEGEEKKGKEMQIATIELYDDSKKASANNIHSSHEDSQKECNMIGETPLHIAIMYDDLSTIKYLIDVKGFDVNQRSVGGKFTGGFGNKITSNLIQQSKYEGLAYYGEYPLAFAACFANKEIYDYLIEKRADPNLQGNFNKNDLIISFNSFLNSCLFLNNKKTQMVIRFFTF